MSLPFRAAAAAALLMAVWAGPHAAESVSGRSAFEGYRRYADEPVADWRATNERVGRIGGWQSYAREAAAPAAQAASGAASGPATVAVPASAPEAGHDAHHSGQGR
jgi:hypothetical protein